MGHLANEYHEGPCCSRSAHFLPVESERHARNQTINVIAPGQTRSGDNGKVADFERALGSNALLLGKALFCLPHRQQFMDGLLVHTWSIKLNRRCGSEWAMDCSNNASLANGRNYMRDWFYYVQGRYSYLLDATNYLLLS